MQVRSLGKLIKEALNTLAINVENNNDDDIKVDDIDKTKSLVEQAIKQAKVEGKDESSYIYRTISGIFDDLSKSKIQSAFKNLKNIKDVVLPFDFIEFFELFEATLKTAEQLEDKTCWVLLGPTGAGKSTSIHYLCGSEFKVNKELGGAITVSKVNLNSLKNKNIKIGANVTKSETRHIDEIYLNLEKLGMKGRNKPKSVLLVDSPGFEDTAGPEVNVSNGIGMVRALQRAKQIKVIVTFKAAHLDYRFKIIRSIANNLGKAITGLEQMLDDDRSPIAGFLTKSIDDVSVVQKIFQKAYKEQESETGESENAHFKALIYKLGEVGPLYRINIDPNDKNKNNEERIKIIKDLSKNSTYITAPQDTFTEFISDSSMTKLKDQIEIDYRTIENILNNDKYFSNPDYIGFVIVILNNLEKLQDIIQNAGGKIIEGKLQLCKDILKTKWNHKINKANKIISNTQDVNIKLLNKNLNEFTKIKDSISKSAEILKKYPKYYNDLMDIGCLNTGLNKCFNNEMDIINMNINEIKKEIKIQLNKFGAVNDDNDNDSDKDSNINDDEKDVNDEIKEDITKIDNNNNNNNMMKDFISPKNRENELLLSIQKCCMLYKKYKDDNKNIKKQFKQMKLEISKTIESLCKKCDYFIGQKNSKTGDGALILMFMYNKISRLYTLLNTIEINLSTKELEPQTSDHEYDDETVDDVKKKLKKPSIFTNIQNTIKKLKTIVKKNIKQLCRYFNLNELDIDDSDLESVYEAGSTLGGTEPKHKRRNSAFIVGKVKLRTDDDKTREVKLVNFTKWLTGFYDVLLRTDTYEIQIFEGLKIWFDTVQSSFIELLSKSCLEVLQICSDFLLNQGPDKWNEVELLLKECNLLRKVPEVSNATSQDYFSILSEFDYRRNELSTQAAELINMLNNSNDDEKNRKPFNWGKIIKIVNQLVSVGCSKNSNEIKQIYRRIKEHLNELRYKTETFVLSLERCDELNIIQNTMNELNTLQTLSDSMPDIKDTAIECYKILNEQVLNILNEIKNKFNLEKYSTKNSRNLLNALEIYHKMRSGIEKDVLINIISKNYDKNLGKIVDKNNKNIDELNAKNKELNDIIMKAGEKVITELKNTERLHKKGRRIMLNGTDDDLIDFLRENKYKNLKGILQKIEELKTKSNDICPTERDKQKINNKKLKELKRINEEINKYILGEQEVLLLKPESVIRYRTDEDFLKTEILKLKKELEGNSKYIFSDQLPLYDAYNSLKFLEKCKSIKWKFKSISNKNQSETILSNMYIDKIYREVKSYLKEYGNNLDTNFNDLLTKCSLTDVSKCDLNNPEYVNETQNIISKLNECLLEFREISNFDNQIKMNIENDNKKEKQITLIPNLFLNNKIQLGIDKYISETISQHKREITVKYRQWKLIRKEKLPLLHFLCLSMSTIDRFIVYDYSKTGSYLDIATKIDGELSKFGSKATNEILPLFQNRSWNELRKVLDNLKKAGDADKEGVAHQAYRDSIMKVYSALNKLINDVKTRLITEINRDVTVNDQKVLSLNKDLKDAQNGVEILYKHLDNDDERNRLKEKELGLGKMLTDRLRKLMESALIAVQKKEFRICEKRLENIDKLMEYGTSFTTVTDDKKINDNDNDSKNDNNNEKNNSDGSVLALSNQKQQLMEDIEKVLTNIREQVTNANKDLNEGTGYNPYQKLKLKKLYEQLENSSNEKFKKLWEDISDDIITQIRDILNRINERNTFQINIKDNKNKNIITFSQQENYFRRIKTSLSLFPKDIKEPIQDVYKEAIENAKGSEKNIEQLYNEALQYSAWNEISNYLIEFEKSNPKLFNESRRVMVKKSSDIYKEFDINFKKDNIQTIIDSLNSYKDLGINFTHLKYPKTKYGSKDDITDDDTKNDNKNNDNICYIDNIEKTLKRIYDQIEIKFLNHHKQTQSCLTGQKSFKLLEKSFSFIIKLLENKEKIPIIYNKTITSASKDIIEPINKFINILKVRKTKGLDKINCDIDSLIILLDNLKELTDTDFFTNTKILLPLCDIKIDKIFSNDIEKISYDTITKETKKMLNEFKDMITTNGINENIIQTNQAKRMKYIEDLSMKNKTIIKSLGICKKHLSLNEKEFESEFIDPCTNKIGDDIKKIQNKTKETFNEDELDINNLEKANANLETLYVLKNVFEKKIGDKKVLNKLDITNKTKDCEKTAQNRIKKISQEIQNIDNNDVQKHIKQSAKNLIYLQYLTQCLNYKTDTNLNNTGNDETGDNETNIVKKKVDKVIKDSMKFLANNNKTKKKINMLYNSIVQCDANYGSVFTQSQPVFKSSLQAFFNKRFRELDINGIIDSLKNSKDEFNFKGLIELDFDKIKKNFNKVLKKYDDYIQNSLTEAENFDDLKENKIPQIATDIKALAEKARATRKPKLEKLYDEMIKFTKISNNSMITKMAKSIGSWIFGESNESKNTEKPNIQEQVKKNYQDPRSCYWTSDMKNVIIELIPGILAVWTLSDASCYFDSEGDKNSTLKKARNAQIIAIMSILCLDFNSSHYKNEKALFNNLVEVGTGEGKSVIMAVTAIVLALLGFDVYCACYSQLLSTRDQLSFNDLFLAFNVQNHIKYNTFNKIFEESINDGGNIREITKNIILSNEINNDNVDIKVDNDESRHQFMNKRQKILFIDEVDKFFSTDFFGQQYAPSVLIPKKEINELIKFIWNQYLEKNEDAFKITVQLIQESEQYKNVLNAFNNEWHDLLNESIKDMIDGIQTFKDDKSYKIINGKDIAYKFSDTYSTRVFKGYRTLFTYLYELNKGNITDEDHVNTKFGWSIKCGSFLYSQIPYDFYSILGVTGTLKSLSDKEHEVMQKSYGIKKYVVMPSLFDKSGKLEYSQNKDLLILDHKRFYNELGGVIQRYQKNNIGNVERPIIIFFKDEDTLQYFYNHDVCKVWKLNNRIQLLTPDLNENEKRNGILKATKPNQITLATEEYGRGIDFKVLDPKIETKGMHVELTYWPSTCAEEIQIKGRTARQGQYGSFHITLNQNEIIDEYDEVTEEGINKQKDNGTLYDWLDKFRREIFGTKYDEAKSYVKGLKPIHNESEKLAESLRNKDIPTAKEKLLIFNKGANIKSAAKLSIIIDSTGSMSSCLNRCKTVISATIPILINFLKDNGINSETFEIQVIAYRNYNAPSDKILEYSEFTYDVNVLTQFVHSLKASYGWGNEAIEIAFNQLNFQKKKPNVILLMADAPANTLDEIKYKRDNKYKESYWQKEKDGRFKTIKTWKDELDEFMGKEDPTVHCFYLKNRAKNNFEEIAKIGKGKCKYLNVNNETESIGLLQSALCDEILVKITGGKDILEKFRKKYKDIPTFL